jgi:hypothetical protein
LENKSSEGFEIWKGNNALQKEFRNQPKKNEKEKRSREPQASKAAAFSATNSAVHCGKLNHALLLHCCRHLRRLRARGTCGSEVVHKTSADEDIRAEQIEDGARVIVLRDETAKESRIRAKLNSDEAFVASFVSHEVAAAEARSSGAQIENNRSRSVV